MTPILVSRLTLVFAVCMVLGLPDLAHAVAQEDTVNHTGGSEVDSAEKPVIKKASSKKSRIKKPGSRPSPLSKKQEAKKKHGFLKAPTASVKSGARPILGTPDPNVDEPSEMITAIKNGAQDKFWEGKRPYPEQVRDRAAQPSAPVFTGTIAQKELQKRGASHDNKTGEDGDSVTNPTLANHNALRRVSYSELSGVTFDDQPLRMSASEPFRRSLDTVSFELGRPCKNQEYLGWPMQQSEQSRVNGIFEATNERLKLRGFDIVSRKARSVGSDVAAFTADRGDTKILGLWSAGDVGLLLLICDSQTPQEAAYAAKLRQQADAASGKKPLKPVLKAKKKPRKKSVRKPSAVIGQPDSPVDPQTATQSAAQPDVPQKQEEPSAVVPLVPAQTEVKPEDARPQVIPGAPSRTLPAEFLPETPSPEKTSPDKPVSENPGTAFIPADVPPPKAETEGATPEDMKAIPPQMPLATSPPVTDVKP